MHPAGAPGAPCRAPYSGPVHACPPASTSAPAAYSRFCRCRRPHPRPESPGEPSHRRRGGSPRGAVAPRGAPPAYSRPCCPARTAAGPAGTAWCRGPARRSPCAPGSPTAGARCSCAGPRPAPVRRRSTQAPRRRRCAGSRPPVPRRGSPMLWRPVARA